MGDPANLSNPLIYDVRPDVKERREVVPADAEPTEAEKIESARYVLKPWIMPTGNPFIKDPAERYMRPDGNPGSDCEFVQADFDDSSWQLLALPHDWAIEGPFCGGWGAPVGGGMGRLPSPGIGWYRKKLTLPASDSGKSIYLDVDGAMSYAAVWVNGNLAGGWPCGYSSWRVDLTPYVLFGAANQLAIRLDNPPESSRWYPGGGIYRSVHLTKTSSVHVGHWGTYITTPSVSEASAVIELEVAVDNDSPAAVEAAVVTHIFELSAVGKRAARPSAVIEPESVSIAAGASAAAKGAVVLAAPRLWGPVPEQRPNLYLAVTSIQMAGVIVDSYETKFGIRSLQFDADSGVSVNGERITIKGANQHHDLGALGAAFNERAARRQLEMLLEAGCNAIRMAHNPPAPELLAMTDEMGFLVIDEIFDAWERKKTPLDFHLIFPDWHEQDVRSFVRRDRNHPSIIAWSFGNEVGEQYTGEQGASVARRLNKIVKEEDATRPTTVSMNYAKPDMPLPAVVDLISLNYQGEGIRNAPMYSGMQGIKTEPLYPAFHEAFPDKVIISSENAAALSSRGTYLFPVTKEISAPMRTEGAGDAKQYHVSAYELFTADFGSSADKVFASLDSHPYVAGGFVWSGWDYLGEPTPYYEARSSYFGIIDLAGFKKDRFYLYQSYWRPQLPMAHILPHWTWPERVGLATPVHVFTSGDEAELFLNGRSLGRRRKGEYEYRLRWDDVVYEPGELRVMAYRRGERWASETVRTAGEPAKIELASDREAIKADGKDLFFITAKITDSRGIVVPRADNKLRFTVEGAGEIVATDNGDPASLVSFASHEREAFNGLCLVIVRGTAGREGAVTVKAESEGLAVAQVALRSER